jgi:serine/threonine protein kinase
MTLDRLAVSLETKIAEGEYGIIFAGKVRIGTESRVAAIKQPKPLHRARFALEMKLMSEIDVAGGHKYNIVKVLGFVEGDDPLLVLEFHRLGSLESYFARMKRVDSGSSTKPTCSQLTKYGLDVARAMGFLEARHFVHRDLAARNVLLTDDYVCKLTDFGLSRSTASKGYYRASDCSPQVPCRWMAPETLDRSVSTIESDRWSFAVLLWEIFSLGEWPYAKISENSEILKHIQEEGRRLSKPAVCPDKIYQLMLRCWSNDPNERPPFDQIYNELDLAQATTKSQYRK